MEKRNVNISIEKLVESINIITGNMEESTAKIKNQIQKALIDAVNNVETKPLMEHKITITERFYGKKLNDSSFASKIEHVEYDIHDDDTLIYHERMNEEWFQHKGIRPEINALINLSSANKSKDSCNVCYNRSKPVGFFGKIFRKLFNFK